MIDQDIYDFLIKESLRVGKAENRVVKISEVIRETLKKQMK